MEEDRSFYVDRLEQCVAEIDDLRGTTAKDPEFKTWKNRVLRTLKKLFGEESDYVRDFSSLRFWEARVGPTSWTGRDNNLYSRALYRAEALLTEALEEYREIPDATVEGEAAASPARKRPKDAPVGRQTIQLVIQQSQAVAQKQAVDFNQVIQSVGQLGLPPEKEVEARALAEEFRAEAEGDEAGRWGRLGPLIDRMKELGGAVWERVAVPLIVEAIRRQL